MMSSKKIISAMLTIVIGITAMTMLLLSPREAFRQLALTALGIIPSFISFVLFANSNKNKTEEETNQLYENIRKTVKESAEKGSENSKGNENMSSESSDILELMLANMKEIKDYYVLSKIQAKNSFF